MSSISSKKQTKTSLIVVKLNSFVRFLEESSAWKNHFDFVWILWVRRLHFADLENCGKFELEIESWEYSKFFSCDLIYDQCALCADSAASKTSIAANSINHPSILPAFWHKHAQKLSLNKILIFETTAWAQWNTHKKLKSS